MTTRIVKTTNKSRKSVGLVKVKRPKLQLGQGRRPPRNLFSQYGMTNTPSNVPKIGRGSKEGSIVVTNSEFFGSVTATDALFHILAYPIQPGIGIVFPWLSGIANSYDGYKILKMMFEFKTNSGSNNTGHVMTAIDYDSHDAIPPDELALSQNYGATPHSIWESNSYQLYDVSKNGFYNKHYTRAGVVPDTDIKTYDSGNFYFGYISGTNINIGTLWVHYTIELYNTQPSVIPGGFMDLTVGVDMTHTLGTSFDTDSNPEAFPIIYLSGLVAVFVVPFEGVVIWKGYGTTITNLAITTTGTTIQDNGAVITAAATSGIDIKIIRALAGDTITFTPTAAAFTESYLYFYSSKPSQTEY